MSKRSDTKELFQQGKLLTIHDIIYLEMSRLGYKITHKLIPEPLVDLFNRNGGKKCHGYQARGKYTKYSKAPNCTI